MACSPVRETMRALFFALGALACSGAADAPAFVKVDGTRAIDVVKQAILGCLDQAG